MAPLYRARKGRPQVFAVAAAEFLLLSRAVQIRVKNPSSAILGTCLMCTLVMVCVCGVKRRKAARGTSWVNLYCARHESIIKNLLLYLISLTVHDMDFYLSQHGGGEYLCTRPQCCASSMSIFQIKAYDETEVIFHILCLNAYGILSLKHQ